MSKRRTIAFIQDTMTVQGGDHPFGSHIRTRVAAEHVASVVRLDTIHKVGMAELKRAMEEGRLTWGRLTWD